MEFLSSLILNQIKHHLIFVNFSKTYEYNDRNNHLFGLTMNILLKKKKKRIHHNLNFLIVYKQFSTTSKKHYIYIYISEFLFKENNEVLLIRAFQQTILFHFLHFLIKEVNQNSYLLISFQYQQNLAYRLD